MKVKQLIEKLRALDPEAEIVVASHEVPEWANEINVLLERRTYFRYPKEPIEAVVLELGEVAYAADWTQWPELTEGK